MSDYWVERARAAEEEVDRLERWIAEQPYGEVSRYDYEDALDKIKRLEEKIELLSKRDVLAAAFIELVQKHQELLAAVMEFKPAPTTPVSSEPVRWGPTYAPPVPPSDVALPKPTPKLTYDQVTHQLRNAVDTPVEGTWGTFSHCGKSYWHGPHSHVAIFNEGPTAPLFCNGEGAPNGN